MNTSTTPLADRLRWSWDLHEPGTRAARATQATLGFYLVVCGSTVAVLATVFGNRPHEPGILATCGGGYLVALVWVALAVFTLDAVRERRRPLSPLPARSAPSATPAQ